MLWNNYISAVCVDIVPDTMGQARQNSEKLKLLFENIIDFLPMNGISIWIYVVCHGKISCM